jgi:hypothetical protein
MQQFWRARPDSIDLSLLKLKLIDFRSRIGTGICISTTSDTQWNREENFAQSCKAQSFMSQILLCCGRTRLSQLS